MKLIYFANLLVLRYVTATNDSGFLDVWKLTSRALRFEEDVSCFIWSLTISFWKREINKPNNLKKKKIGFKVEGKKSPVSRKDADDVETFLLLGIEKETSAEIRGF